MNLQDIGSRIYYLRTEVLNLPQRDFAQRMGIAQSHISKVEKGMSLPGCYFMAGLYKSYQININWLLSGEGELHIHP
ncbi:helix-turn-helix transcriptional regulator [Cytophagaceae bacterium YF14B1]|uniref:Helix-turn-helix transcriptional regulator n=1 Tax=Xanthocytophaga flava TaxID=3048013 RepID=A0AAE3U7B7_9BACT|nr:helix-turn-helix transcriptional regulator [Xanthocytophaga flavus]MDJ1479958.1 helix-turn-helix transcriptional regulator [Xanthocytophaga flavus]